MSNDTLGNVKSALMRKFGTMGIDPLMNVYLAVRADIIDLVRQTMTEHSPGRIVPLHDDDGTIDFQDREDGHSHHYVPGSLLMGARADFERLTRELEAQARITIVIREKWAAEMTRADRAEEALAKVNL